MSFEKVKFLSGWVSLDERSIAMEGRRGTLEIENKGGDFLIFEYAYPSREEERGISVTIKIFEEIIGRFRGFYSFPFYIGFKIPTSLQKKLFLTIEVDHTFFRTDPQGNRRELGIILFHLELLDKNTDPSKYQIFEKKVGNLKEHFLKISNPTREAQPLPLAFLIEPSSRCNMDCVMCARSIPGHKKEEECDLSDEFIPPLAQSMVGIQASRIQGLGEPLISKNFIPLMDLLEKNHVHTLTFNTNGYLLNEEMARWLVQKGKAFEHYRISFSLDAATKDTYYKIRGKDLERVLKNIRYLQDYKRKTGISNPSVFINMVLSRTNIKDLPKFIKLAYGLDAQVELNNLAIDKSYESIQIKRGDAFSFNYRTEILTAYPALYKKYLKKAEELGRKLNVTIHKASDVTYMDIPRPRFSFLSFFKEALRKPFRAKQKDKLLEAFFEPTRERDSSFEKLPLCLLPWSQMVISSKGGISLCCVQNPFDHLKNYTTIEEAWHSEKVCRIREQLSQKLFPPECQAADCTVRKWNSRVCIIYQ